MNLKSFFLLVVAIMGLMVTNLINVFGEETGEYLIKINRVQNCVTVFKKDDKGKFTVPFKSMVCSVGLNIEDTPLGTFTISEKQEWGSLVDDSYGQYCSRIIESIMIHSVPYSENDKSTLKTEEFNKLGEPASLGCIRMKAADAKWIFDNCSEGTEVVIYDDNVSPGPLGKPESVKIPEEHEFAGWDPTDDDGLNPWKSLNPVINGVQDIEIEAGEEADMFENISASDILGNDISGLIKLEGEYNQEKAGIYKLEYTVTDGFGYTARENFIFTVKENSNETTESKTPELNTEEKISTPKTGAGPIMKIIFIAVCTFIVSSLIVRLYKR